jgi:hypothetical protein
MELSTTTDICPQCCGKGKCGFQGQAKSGDACLCGYGELAYASIPPRFFRHRSKTGTMNMIRSPDAICDMPTTPGNISGSKRGAVLSLIGFAEFASPSTPPNWYLRKAWSGTMRYQEYSDAACANRITGHYCQIDESGAWEYSASTGAVIEQDGQYTHPSPCNPSGVPILHGVNDGPFCWGGPCTTTKTKTLWALSAACGTTCGGGNSCGAAAPETNSAATLTNIDGEANAITRWMNTSPAWSGYSACGTPPNPWCLAQYEQRTGQTFHYQECKFNVTKSGLVAGKLYHATVDVYRSPYGAGTYSLYQTLVLTGTTDGSGNLAINDQVVPNAIGFDTYVTNAVILLADSMVDTWNQTGQYNAATCVLVATDTSTRVTDGLADPAGVNESDYAIAAGGVTVAWTATTRILTGAGACVYAPRSVGDPFPWVKCTGTVTETLSDEDLETDAMNRLFAPQVYSGHSVTSVMQPRVAGQQCFLATKSQVKATFADLTPGQDYEGVINFVTRDAGTADDWTDYGQQTFSFTATGPIETTPWVDVPLVSGMEVMALSCAAVPG